MAFNFNKYKEAVTGSPLNKGEKGEGSGKSITRKQHAGDIGRRATATKAQDKSGYSRSGGDYINVHSFTGNTRLSSSLANTLGPSISSAVRGIGNIGTMEDFNVDNIFGTDTRLVPGTKTPPQDYKPFWDNLIGDKTKWTPEMKRIIGKHGGDLDAAYDEWYEISTRPENVQRRREERESRTTTDGHTEYRDYQIVDDEKQYTTDWYRK